MGKVGNSNWMLAYLKLTKTICHIILAIHASFTSLCGVTSQSVCLILGLALADPYIHINDYKFTFSQYTVLYLR